MTEYRRKYKGQTIYKCKVNGCLPTPSWAKYSAMCARIACGSDQCKAHGNEQCEHKVKKDD
jgi:hypothetical protein